jgi:hypothetical protein
MTSEICRPMVISGLSADIGSWKIMAIDLPRRCRRLAGDMRSRSVPLNRISPRVTPILRGSSPMMALAVTDLPDPDSPTMHRISPAIRSNETSSTAKRRSILWGSSAVRFLTDRSGLSLYAGKSAIISDRATAPSLPSRS